jgi:2-keto-3-deoxy-L-fuconate dehydrogenase
MSIQIKYFAEGSEAVALVTGAASGIGSATARRLHEAGLRKFVLVDRNADALRQSVAELSASDVVLRVHDVADEAAWRETMESTNRFGRLDLVVASAGVADAAAITDMDFALWRRVLSTNLDGVFLTLKHGMSLMKRAGRGGSIVVVSSVSAIKSEITTGAYGASKAAVAQLTKVAAKEGAPDGIRVNAILPGGVETPIWRSVPYFQDRVRELGSEQAALAEMGRQMPLGRYATAVEIADQIVYLLAGAGGPMTGAQVVVDSGYSL